jgi:8-oxo-dGTP pyrophosphatase MutT (NUDIX family)
MSKQKKYGEYQNTFCGNCGNLGHTYKGCKLPITSCGVILFKNNENYNEECKLDNRYKFLLIQRKDTLGFIEFLRGKYIDTDYKYIQRLLEMMTVCEIDKLMKHTFDELWNILWFNRNMNHYKNEYEESKKKFNRINERKENSLKELIKISNITYIEKDWGFPKGRRNLRETDYDCALREFDEETGYKRDEYNVLKNIAPIEEVFYGSNGIKYKHTYYIGQSNKDIELKIDPKNFHQCTEISKIGWFTLLESLQKIRHYNEEKKTVLKKVNKLLKNNNC